MKTNEDVYRIVWMNEQFPQDYSKRLERRFQQTLPWRSEKEKADFLQGYHEFIMSKGGFKMPGGEK